MRISSDACGCFPTGRHYAGISHLLRTQIRGLAKAFAADTPWREIPIAFIDVETTGRDASSERIVEIGIVIGRNGEIVARHNWLVHPERPIPAEVSAIHGIMDEHVKDSPTFKAIVHEIAAALEGCLPAAYNAPFDRAFVHNEFRRTEYTATQPHALHEDVEWGDPLIWARELHKSEKSRTLADVAARLGISLENAHRASADAEAALLVLYKFAEDARVPTSYGGFVQEQRRLSMAQSDQRRFWRT